MWPTKTTDRPGALIRAAQSSPDKGARIGAKAMLPLLAALSFSPSSFDARAAEAAPASPASATNQVASLLDQKLDAMAADFTKLPAEQRKKAARNWGKEIGAMPVGQDRTSLAMAALCLVQQNGPDLETMQAVADLLAPVVIPSSAGPSSDYNLKTARYFMALLVRYEGVKTALTSDEFASRLSKLESVEKKVANGEFKLADVTGKTWTLQELRGKAVMINLWATWCGPCREELPLLQATYERYQGDLVILGVASDPIEELRRFLADKKLTYPILPDLEVLDKGDMGKVSSSFKPMGLPTALVIDREGKVVDQTIGGLNSGWLDRALRKAGLTVKGK